MLRIENAILLNQYAQGLIDSDIIVDYFLKLDIFDKRNYLNEIKALIFQNKSIKSDVPTAIIESNLKPTFTPCVLILKGELNIQLRKIINMPEQEMKKSLLLILGLFKVSYLRNFSLEKDNPNKWWYWDLSDRGKINNILEMFN